MLAEMRYLVTPEGIAEYRERMRQVYIRRAGASYGLVERSGDMYLLLQRYTRAISAWISFERGGRQAAADALENQ